MLASLETTCTCFASYFSGFSFSVFVHFSSSTCLLSTLLGVSLYIQSWLPRFQTSPGCWRFSRVQHQPKSLFWLLRTAAYWTSLPDASQRGQLCTSKTKLNPYLRKEYFHLSDCPSQNISRLFLLLSGSFIPPSFSLLTASTWVYPCPL